MSNKRKQVRVWACFYLKYEVIIMWQRVDSLVASFLSMLKNYQLFVTNQV